MPKRPNPDIDAFAQMYEDSIREGMARYLWLSAFASWADGADLVQDQDVSIADIGPGADWDDIAPETPAAADKAAKDLVDLFVLSEGLGSSKTPMAELFAFAVSVHQAKEFEYGQATVSVPKRGGRGKTEDLDTNKLAYEFGSLMAAQAIGEGIGWGDDHREEWKTQDGKVVEFAPDVPDFECHYTGSDLSWSGATRGRAEPERAHGSEDAPHWTRYPNEEGPTAPQGLPTIGRITIINPGDKSWTRHRYVLWFDAHAPLYLMAFANSLDDALDECVDYLEDANLPGYFVDDIVNAEFARFVAEGMDEEDAREHAEADTTTAGNHGRYLNSEDWGVEAEDPTDAQLRQIGQVDEMREAAQHDREYAERHRELMRPKIWVSEMSAEVARKLHERPGTPIENLDFSIKHVPTGREGTMSSIDLGPSSELADVDAAIGYLMEHSAHEARWNTGEIAGSFIPRNWYLSPAIDGVRRAYVLDNFTIDQQRAIYNALTGVP
jgi:hypothetical protein